MTFDQCALDFVLVKPQPGWSNGSSDGTVQAATTWWCCVFVAHEVLAEFAVPIFNWESFNGP